MATLLSISPNEVKKIDLTGISTIRGKQEYALVHVKDDLIEIHPLVGSDRTPKKLKPLEPFRIEELTIFLLPQNFGDGAQESELTLPDISEILGTFSDTRDLQAAFVKLLDALLSCTGMEKGLIVAKSLTNKFGVISAVGLNPEDPWLSETIVQEVINTKKRQVVTNVIGSVFDKKKSLIATGFLSVFCWPLLVRGDVKGVLFVASSKPNTGIVAEILQRCEIIVNLCALLLSFHIRENQFEEDLRNLRKSFGVEDFPFITSNSKLIETCKVASRVADSDLSILITGETGVGKELMAGWLHQRSSRARRPFVSINCGSIPSELLESQLFGHKRGAFTGAVADYVGKIQQADTGTLFLDEIGDLPLELQVKLLRVLQERKIEPLGSNKVIPVDIRIVCATHKDLRRLVGEGKFREDLFYRLAEMQLEIPPLRERPEDIGLLAAKFLNDLKSVKKLSQTAIQWLQQQKWAGNVRELLSTIRRAEVLSQNGEISVQDLGMGGPAPAKTSSNWLGGKDLEEARDNFVGEKIRQALERSGGNRTRAADLLGITPRTLFRYLETYDKSVIGH